MGDCYFLSSLSVLAEHERRITRLFSSAEVNENGVYQVTLTKNGVKMAVCVDDFIPCKHHEPCFARAHGNELWVLIAEKAWAKIHGSYERVEGG